jgi:hypothetical protein
MAESKDTTLIDAIRELKKQEPFEPFQIVMTSGDKYLIENGENLVEMATQFFYAFPRSNRFVLMRTFDIVAVEKLENKPAA